MESQKFRSYSIGLTANVEFSLDMDGDMFAVTSNTSAFDITFDESNRILGASAGMGARFDSRYTRVKFLSTTTQTVVVVLGTGDFKDARSSINATINANVAPANILGIANDIDIPNTATLIAAADATRKELIVNLPSAASDPIRIGTSSVTATSGLQIEPGISMVLSAECDVYGISTTSTTQTINTLSMERV